MINSIVNKAIENAKRNGALKIPFTKNCRVYVKPQQVFENGTYKTKRYDAPYFFERYVTENVAEIRDILGNTTQTNIENLSTSRVY